MGVNHTVYALVGIAVSCEEDISYVRDIFHGDVDRFESGETRIDVIIDQMCGEYAVVGIVLKSLCRHEPAHPWSGIMGTELIENNRILAYNEIMKHFPKLVYPAAGYGQISFMIFSHYS